MKTNMHKLQLFATSLLLVGLLVAPPPLQAQEPADNEVLTLHTAVRQAVQFSPQLKASNEKLEQAKAQLWQAYGMLLPFVTVKGSYTRADERIALDFGSFGDLFALAMMNCGAWDETSMGPRPAMCDAPPAPTDTEEDSDSGGARVMQELNNFDASITVGMSLLNARTLPLIKNVYTGEELAKLQKDFAEEQLVFAVIQMYYGVSTTQSVVLLMEQTLGTAMRHLELTEIRRKNGVALENERIRAAMTVLQARNAVDQAKAAFDLSRRSLAILLGRDDAAFVVEEFPDHPWIGLDPTAPETDLLEQRLDIRMFDKFELMAERNVTDIWMKFVPTVQGMWTFSGSSNKGFADRYTQWRAMVTLNWNLFEGGMRFAELDVARSKVRETRYNRSAALLKARTEVQGALSGIETARTDLSTAVEMEALAGQNLTLVEKQYKHGVAQQTVILDAESQLQSARIQALQGRLRLALAQISLARSLGLVSADHFAQ